MSSAVKDWQRRPLGELSKTTSGGTPSRKRKDYFDGSIPWVKSGELNDDYIEGTGEHISEEGLKNSSAKLFQPGTLLIALYGATVGKTSILRIEATDRKFLFAVALGEGVSRRNPPTNPTTAWPTTSRPRTAAALITSADSP